jgi:hypothetical protein
LPGAAGAEVQVGPSAAELPVELPEAAQQDAAGAELPAGAASGSATQLAWAQLARRLPASAQPASGP